VKTLKNIENTEEKLQNTQISVVAVAARVKTLKNIENTQEKLQNTPISVVAVAVAVARESLKNIGKQ